MSRSVQQPPEPTPLGLEGIPDHDKLIKLEAAINEERRARYYIQLSVQEINENIKWAVKIVMGTVITAILAGVVVRQIPVGGGENARRSTESRREQPSASSSSSSDETDGALRHH